MKLTKKISSYFAVVFAFLFPIISRAATSGLWKDTSCSVGSEGPVNACTTCAMFIVARNAVGMMRDIAAAIVVGMIVYGAVKLMISRGSPEKAKEARGIMTKSVIGLLIILVSYLIVNTFISVLGSGSNWDWSHWNTIQC